MWDFGIRFDYDLTGGWRKSGPFECAPHIAYAGPGTALGYCPVLDAVTVRITQSRPRRFLWLFELEPEMTTALVRVRADGAAEPAPTGQCCEQLHAVELRLLRAWNPPAGQLQRGPRGCLIEQRAGYWRVVGTPSPRADWVRLAVLFRC